MEKFSDVNNSFTVLPSQPIGIPIYVNQSSNVTQTNILPET